MSNPIGTSPWTDNRLTARLRLRYPIIQGPFGGFASQKLTAAVSNYGALGSFGASSLTPDALREMVREIKKLTSQPFASREDLNYLLERIDRPADAGRPIEHATAA